MDERTKQAVKTWLEVCDQQADSLTRDERNFLEYAYDQFAFKGGLTEDQMTRLKQMYDKVV